MKKIKVAKFFYSHALGDMELKDVELYLDDEDLKKYEAGVDIESLDYAIGGDIIEDTEKLIAKKFFLETYRKVLDDKQTLTGVQIRAIQNFLRLNRVDFSRILFIEKSALTNIYDRNKASRSVCGQVLERLGQELARPGACLAMVRKTHELKAAEPDITEEVDRVRYELQA